MKVTNTIFESYEQYIDMRESIRWVANIPNTVNNLVLLYSLPLKTEEEYNAIKEFDPIIPYSGYVYLYKQQADPRGIEIDRNALYNKLTFNIDTKSGSIMPLQEKLKAIFEAYTVVSEKYKLFESEHLKKT